MRRVGALIVLLGAGCPGSGSGLAREGGVPVEDGFGFRDSAVSGDRGASGDGGADAATRDARSSDGGGRDGARDGRPADTRPVADAGCAQGAKLRCGPCQLGEQTCGRGGVWGNCVVPPTVCTPKATRKCGNCNRGDEECGSGCAWGGCKNQPCRPGVDTQGCANGCGQRSCDGSCNWTGCSMAGQYVRPSGSTCFSQNHPCPAGPRPLCVACWLKCDGNGNTYRDEWCASCSDCGAAQSCP
ncbi:MAG: hypothetical protein IT371_09485 [Deltaproteobacteria bacterium]|nr:hypothetical protein [Deltaproteobacteria bacterium]